jgi:hypothetical protein
MILHERDPIGQDPFVGTHFVGRSRKMVRSIIGSRLLGRSKRDVKKTALRKRRGEVSQTVFAKTDYQQGWPIASTKMIERQRGTVFSNTAIAKAGRDKSSKAAEAERQ